MYITTMTYYDDYNIADSMTISLDTCYKWPQLIIAQLNLFGQS